MKRYLALFLALLTLVSLCACAKNGGDSTAESSAPTTQAPTAPSTEPSTEAPTDAPVADEGGATVVMESEDYVLTAAHMQFFFATVYDDFASQYGDMISYMLDTSKPLKEQSCPLDQSGKMTWFDYFADGALTSAKGYITLAEEAKAAGYSLSEDDKAMIEGQLKTLDDVAKAKKYPSTEEYLKAFYGEYMTEAILRECFELFILANSYRELLYSGYSFTEEDYLAYAKKNPASCYVADFMYMRINADVDKDMTDDKKKALWQSTKDQAVAFNNAIKDKDSFISLAESYMRTKLTVVEDEKDADPQANKVTEAQLKELAASTYTKGVAYATGGPNVDWIFAKGRLSGEQTIIYDEENMACEIIYMVKPMYLQDVPTVDVRHILLEVKDQKEAGTVKIKAEALLDKWKKGDATEDSFAALAAENTQDPGSATTGGLYEAVTPGKMVAEFNDWCFDESRKAGDTDIVKTDYGYHIMYFSSQGLPLWKRNADTALRDAAIAEATKKMETAHPVTLKDTTLSILPDPFAK